MTEREDYGLSVTAERILKAASRVGHYMPQTKEQMRIAQVLRRKELLEQSDTLPGSFEITREGEAVLQKLGEYA